MIRWLPHIAVTVFCAATLYQIHAPPGPRLIYNSSASAPTGWYRLHTDRDVKRGSLVAGFAPDKARELAHERGYLPEHVPLIKTVWAVGGERICVRNGRVSAQNRPDIYARAQDDFGRELPQLEGCFTLNVDEVFLVSIDVQTSWDSRYFGAVPMEKILGTVTYLGNKSERSDTLGGWARVKGVEGKIKANSAPGALSGCLHISFGGTPLGAGSTPILAGLPESMGFIGSAPYPDYHATSRKPQ
ncbi:S26 family signal peptidase [Hyphomonas sp.]|uniref:S26 family signal peptidase n=1 Tax=Hyphomonas sp. TaxID=87 RepID=UPI0025C12023|nr:S26 family signal peptidase [Hyphomonas sp.]